MPREIPTHFELWQNPKSACGLPYAGRTLTVSDDVKRVTCGNCIRTKAYKAKLEREDKA